MSSGSKPQKQLTSVRVSSEAKALWEAAARRLSISQAAVLELALREFTESRGIKPELEAMETDAST